MVTRSFHSFRVTDFSEVKAQLIHWAAGFDTFCVLDNHQYISPYSSYEVIIAVGRAAVFQPSPDYFNSLSDFVSGTNDWIIGHVGYDIKNKIEALTSAHPDYIGFAGSFLFVPQLLVLLNQDELSIGVLKHNAGAVFREIKEQSTTLLTLPKITFTPRISRKQYVAIIRALQQHISKGDCYEINFCQEFYAAPVAIDPASVYRHLTDSSPNPFSCFYGVDGRYLICASPERFLKKEGNTILSQPIKGTWKRDAYNETLDLQNKTALQHSEKDKSENVMVVDLVRNDLSKICIEGSVAVTELFKVYSYPNVHQMISTIGGTLKQNIGFGDILKATFPMGSMTGAPKKKVMELIEQYEGTKRGIFSGTVGYITPQKDFDFNVVIRSILYNSHTQYISNSVGGGITYYSNPYTEYEECLLKSDVIKKLFA